MHVKFNTHTFLRPPHLRLLVIFGFALSCCSCLPAVCVFCTIHYWLVDGVSPYWNFGFSAERAVRNGPIARFSPENFFRKVTVYCGCRSVPCTTPHTRRPQHCVGVSEKYMCACYDKAENIKLLEKTITDGPMCACSERWIVIVLVIIYFIIFIYVHFTRSINFHEKNQQK